MPCFTERTVTLDFTVADEGVLLRALDAIGLAAHVNADLADIARRIVETGRLSITGATMTQDRAEEWARKLKVAYAEDAVKTAAKKFGWNVTVDQKNPQVLNLGRRSF